MTVNIVSHIIEMRRASLTTHMATMLTTINVVSLYGGALLNKMGCVSFFDDITHFLSQHVHSLDNSMSMSP